MPRNGKFSIPDPIGQGALLQFDSATRAFVAFVPLFDAMKSGRWALRFEIKPFEEPDVAVGQAIERRLETGRDCGWPL